MSIQYKGFEIDVVPITRYRVLINGKRASAGIGGLITGRDIDKLVDQTKLYLDAVEKGDLAIKENTGKTYLYFMTAKKTVSQVLGLRK